MTTESNNAALQLFASRFSIDDWQMLLQIPGFDEAVAKGAFDEAEAIAWFELTKDMNRDAISAAEAYCARIKEHAAVCDFVRIWAAKTNRVGGKGKQSRQNHIRKLMKHGLKSEYARKMAVEAGLA